MPVEVLDDGSPYYAARIEIQSPVSSRDVRSLTTKRCVVQYSDPLEPAEHERLGKWFAKSPHAHLRVYAKVPQSLDFLHHYPWLAGFAIDSVYTELTNATGLRHLPDSLQTLSIDVRLPRLSDLDVLHRFRDLRTLQLGYIRHIPESVTGLPVDDLSLGGVKSLAAISSLAGVTTLRLDSVTADLAPLQELQKLEDLTLAIGGSSNLAPLSQIQSLRRFSAWMVRGLDDVTALARHPQLEEIHLERLRQLTALPSLRGASGIKKMTLQYLRGLRDLRPILDAPVLEELKLIEMQHMQVDEVAVLAGHPTLTEIEVGLGSDRKNLAARNALKIRGSYGGHEWPPQEPTIASADSSLL